MYQVQDCLVPLMFKKNTIMKILKNRFPSFLWLGLCCAMAVHELERLANAATLVEQDFDFADGSLVGLRTGHGNIVAEGKVIWLLRKVL